MIRLLLIFLLISFPAIAGPKEDLNQGDQVAQTLLNQMNSKKAAAGAHPFYKNIPKESNYTETDLGGRAQGAAARDPASQMVLQGSNAHAQMKIDPIKDPLLVGSQKVMDNPLEAIGGKGVQVVEVQQGGKTETLKCEESGEDSSETCTRTLKVTVIKTKVTKEKPASLRITGCRKSYKGWHAQSCSSLLNQLIFGRVKYHRSTGYGRKGRTFVKKTEPIDITASFKACSREGSNGCHRCNYPRNTLPKTIPLSRITQVLIERDSSGGGKISGMTNYSKHGNLKGYDLSATIKIIYEEDSYEVLPDEWLSNCDHLEARVDEGLCGYTSKVCTQGRQTRTINDIPITRDCWQESMTYYCSFPAKDDCGPLRARGCAQIHSACARWVGNACVVHQQTYQCKEASRTTHQITGGNTPYCMDGHCRDQSWDPNDELMSSVAQLSILKEMQGNFKNGFLFTGKKHQCSKYVASFKDCCGSGKGWGNDVGLSSCSANEKLLSKKRKLGLCHYVGTYCAKKVLGKCIKKRSSYCCFGSKLLKAFQEQGRAQIRLGWGEPKSPLCRGFTIEEIQRIDFSKLDLREVFEELMKNYKPGKLQGQDKKLEQGMNFPQLHQKGVFDGAREKYAPPPTNQNMSQKVGERLEVIKRGMSPHSGGKQ